MSGKDPKAPGGLLKLRAGESGERNPVSYDHAVVEIKSGNSWLPHPDFPTHAQGGLQEFDIEIISNVVEKTLQSHLTMYAGKLKFCCRAHRGNDGIGVAMRRAEDGRRVAVECDPERCGFRRLHLARKDEPDLVVKQIMRDDLKAFPYLKDAMTGKGGLKVTPCKPDCYLVFALLNLRGEYAHAPSEYCVFHSTSDVNHGRFHDTLYHLWRQTHGQMVGLRLKLVFEPFKNSYNQLIPAWALRVPEGASFEQQQLEAARRRQGGLIDYNKLAEAVDSTALALIGAEKSLAEVAAEMGIEAVDLVRQSLDDAADRQDFLSEYIDPSTVTLVNQNEFVIRMAERMELAYPYLVRLPMRCGSDVFKAMKWLKETADKAEVYVADIWAEYTDTLPGFNQPVVPELPAPAAENEPQDAEFEEVPDESRSIEDLMKDASGRA